MAWLCRGWEEAESGRGRRGISAQAAGQVMRKTTNIGYSYLVMEYFKVAVIDSGEILCNTILVLIPSLSSRPIL